MHRILFNGIKNAWSATQFASDEVSFFAHKLTVDEARQGLMGMSLILVFLFGVEAFLFSRSELGNSAVYSCLLLGLLALHILLSARAIRDAKTLYLLGTTLLIISGTAFVLLAHNSGTFNFALFASITLLFIVVPIVPWGLKEASLVLSLIYVTFTASTWGASQSFDTQTLWSLQFIMLGAGAISLAMVARNTLVRKAGIHNCYELEQANRKMMVLSNKDPLTGAWNRRFLQNEFDTCMQTWHKEGKPCHFAFIDIDNFKPMNDICGHDFGDEVLCCLVRAFGSAIKGHGHIVRMGGDEFSMLFQHDDPQAVISDAYARLNDFIQASGQGCGNQRIGLSVGLVSIAADVTPTMEMVYREADQTLYRAKDRKESCRDKVNIIHADIQSDPTSQNTAV